MNIKELEALDIRDLTLRLLDRSEQHADASDSATTPVPLAPKPMRASITGVVWNCQADQSKCIAAFSHAEYERTHWIGIPIVLEDFKTEVGKVTAAWLSEDERIWITAIVEVPDEFEFRGFGLHVMGLQKHTEVLDPTTVSVVNIALCEPIDPGYRVYCVNPLSEGETMNRTVHDLADIETQK